MIWSPSFIPFSYAGLCGWTPPTKIPTSLPPTSLRPKLLSFINDTVFTSELYLKGIPKESDYCCYDAKTRGNALSKCGTHPGIDDGYESGGRE